MPHLLLRWRSIARAIAEVTNILGWQCSVTDSREAYSTLDGSEEGLHMTLRSSSIRGWILGEIQRHPVARP